MEASAPFALSADELTPVIAQLCGGKAVRVLRVSYDPALQTRQGYGADKAVPTIEYEADGQRATAQVFVKWLHDSGTTEGLHYTHLQRLGAPVARLLRRVITGGREMLFLEYLDCASPVETDSDFVSCIGQFSAITPDAEYLKVLRGRKFEYELLVGRETIARTWDMATRRELGNQLADYCSKHPDLEARLCDLADRCGKAVRHMATGLLHTDLYPENCGWRTSVHGLVVFDLEHVALGPRFFDVARWIGAPARAQADDLKQRQLAKCFLSAYQRHSGSRALLDQLLAESHVLWATGVLVMLWFALKRAIDGRVDWTTDVDAGRASYQNMLLGRLRALEHMAAGVDKAMVL